MILALTAETPELIGVITVVAGAAAAALKIGWTWFTSLFTRFQDEAQSARKEFLDENGKARKEFLDEIKSSRQEFLTGLDKIETSCNQMKQESDKMMFKALSEVNVNLTAIQSILHERGIPGPVASNQKD